MATITYPHLTVTSVSPQPEVTDLVWPLIRLLAFTVGAGAVVIQVSYTWATLPSDELAMRAAPILFAVSLATSLVMAEKHFKRWEVLKALGWLIAFAFLLSCNLQTTITRVAEVRALKSASGEHVGEIQREAKAALVKALADEDEAREQMHHFCEMTTTNADTETTGKGKKTRSTRKTTTSVDPRCASWTELNAAAVAKTNDARSRVANAAVSSSVDGVSPAAKSVALLTKWDEVTVDHAMDFIQPLGLDVLALISFLTAFSSKARQTNPRPRKEKVSTPPTGTPTVVKGLPQVEINALVAQWIGEAGLPLGEGMGACLTTFRKWADLDESQVTPVTFGRAFTVLGIERRSLNGRKVVAGRRATR